MEYHVTVSHVGSTQHVTFNLTEAELLPNYTTEFKDFQGSFDQWIKLSDAIAIYIQFTVVLNGSYTLDAQIGTAELLEHSRPGRPYILSNNHSIETCISRTSSIEQEPYPSVDVWRPSVFYRRLHVKEMESFFDAQIAQDLLINTTINMLSLNERFDTVNAPRRAISTSTNSSTSWRFSYHTACVSDLPFPS